MNFLMTFVVGQSFLSMMCTMKFGIFLFFAGMVCLMSAFVAIVLPETQGIPLVCSLPSNVLCLRTPLLVASHQKLHAASASWHQSLTIYPACRGGGSSITKACVRSAALLHAAVLQGLPSNTSGQGHLRRKKICCAESDVTTWLLDHGSLTMCVWT